jgi:hypothetical protein
MTAEKLAKNFHVSTTSLATNYLTPMKTKGLIANNRRVGGYYRPDAPPQ